MPEFEEPAYGYQSQGCSTCGAAVPEHLERLHTEWHRELFEMAQLTNKIQEALQRGWSL